MTEQEINEKIARFVGGEFEFVRSYNDPAIFDLFMCDEHGIGRNISPFTRSLDSMAMAEAKLSESQYLFYMAIRARESGSIDPTQLSPFDLMRVNKQPPAVRAAALCEVIGEAK